MPTRNAICYSMTTYPICDSRRSFAPLQKSRRNLCSYMWTEALSAMLSIPRKTYLVKCENSLNLTLPTIMLPNTSSSSDDITTRPWVRERENNRFKQRYQKKKLIHLFIYSRKALVFFFIGVVNLKRTRPKGKRKQTKRQKKKQQSLQFHSFSADLSWSVRLHQYSTRRIFDRLKICTFRCPVHTELP